MKRSNGFDARRLRPQSSRSLGARLAAALGVLLVLAGIALAGLGAVSLLDSRDVLAGYSLEHEAAITALSLGLALLLLGMLMRRLARRQSREPGALSLSPRLKTRR